MIRYNTSFLYTLGYMNDYYECNSLFITISRSTKTNKYTFIVSMIRYTQNGAEINKPYQRTIFCLSNQ